MSGGGKVRLHYKDGRVVVEPLIRFARANGLDSIAAARGLLDRWVRERHLRRRSDGGFDVLRPQPRQGR